MIDAGTREQFDRAVRVAMANGRDLGEELDRMGLLLTESRRYLISHAALRGMLVHLEVVGASAILQGAYGRVDGTPADMFDAIQRWAEEYLKTRLGGAG